MYSGRAKRRLNSSTKIHTSGVPVGKKESEAEFNSLAYILTELRGGWIHRFDYSGSQKIFMLFIPVPITRNFRMNYSKNKLLIVTRTPKLKRLNKILPKFLITVRRFVYRAFLLVIYSLPTRFVRRFVTSYSDGFNFSPMVTE